MGWGAGILRGWNPRTKRIERRTVGYTMLVLCDWQGCMTPIDRGLAYRCGEAPEDVDLPVDTLAARGCGAYLCREHIGVECHDCPAIYWWRSDSETHITCIEGHEADDDLIEALNELDWGDAEPKCPACLAEGLTTAVSA